MALLRRVSALHLLVEHAEIFADKYPPVIVETGGQTVGGGVPPYGSVVVPDRKYLERLPADKHVDSLEAVQILREPCPVAGIVRIRCAGGDTTVKLFV